MTPRNEQAFLQSFSKIYADFCIIFNVRRAATFRCIIPRKQRYHSPLSLLRTVFLLLTSFRLSNRRERMEKSRLIIALPIDFSMRRRPKTGGGLVEMTVRRVAAARLNDRALPFSPCHTAERPRYFSIGAAYPSLSFRPNDSERRNLS